MYDGEVVRDEDTPGSLSMEDSDTVEVVLERQFPLLAAYRCSTAVRAVPC
jgi:hypothetical protein